MTLQTFRNTRNPAVRKANRVVDEVNRLSKTLRRDTKKLYNTRRGEIVQGLGTDYIFVGQFFDGTGNTLIDTNIDIVCPLEATAHALVGNQFLAVRKFTGSNNSSWYCIGIYKKQDIIYSSDYLSSDVLSSDHPSSDYWSSGEEPSSDERSSAYWSSGEEPSSDQPSSDLESSGAPSSDQPSSDTPSSDALSSGEEPSSDQPSSDYYSSGEEPSSDQPSSNAPSSGEEPSSDQPSSQTPSSDFPSSNFPSSDQPSTLQSSLGSTGLSSDHPSSDAVSSGDWYDCPATLTITIKGVTPCGNSFEEDGTADEVNGTWTLDKVSGCTYNLYGGTNDPNIRVVIDQSSGEILAASSNYSPGWAFQFIGPVRRGGSYGNENECLGVTYAYKGVEGEAFVF